MTTLILSAINVLTNPPETSGCAAACSQEEALSAALSANRSLLLERLERDARLEQVRRLRAEVMADVLWLSSSSGDVSWDFVQELLVLLLILARHLSAEVEGFERSSPSPVSAEKVPSLSPDVLSVTQQQKLSSALQFVVSLGLCPYLAPGVGVPLAHRSAFAVQLQQLCCGRVEDARRRLFTTTTVLLKMAELPSLGTLVFTRHLNDVMAALCQLGHQRAPVRGGGAGKSLELSPEEVQACRDALGHLLTHTYQPVVIQELLALQNPPRPSPSSSGSSSGPGPAPGWLRRLCGRLLSERLMQPSGVQAVVSAVLGQGTEEPDGRRCEALAWVLVTCPQQAVSAETYYTSVCPQILELLHVPEPLAGRCRGVAVRAVHLLAQDKPGLARPLLLRPLVSPLQRCVPAAGGCPSQAGVDEWELSRCVGDLVKVCVPGDGQPESLLKALQEVLPIIFTLFCFSKRNVSNLRSPCQDLLLWFLSHATGDQALQLLQQLSGLQAQQQAAASLSFRAGSEGGARLCPGDGCRPPGLPTADAEDLVLYEKLSWEQWRLECLVDLLAEMKDSDLPGTFFLLLLQELTDWASCEEEEGDEEELAVASLTLEAGAEQQGSGEPRVARLALLQVLAVMVECLPHTVLLKKRTQVLDFLAALFQRACVGLVGASGPGLVTVVDGEGLSLGMGLLATLLSEAQLSAEDYVPMLKLLPHLETLSQAHPVAAVQELAFDLRGTISTRGAYQPEDLTLKTPLKAKDSKKTPPTGAVQTRGLSEVLLEALDPDVPTRAAALRELTQVVQRTAGEAVQDQEDVLRVFLKSLEHQDSFIYLSAIQGLAVMANRFPQRILQRLLQELQPAPSSPPSDRTPSLEVRLKLGEVLLRASRAMGDLAPHLGHPLVGVFLQGTKDPDPSIRASSLSNLGELCQKLDYSLGPLVQELSSCLTALIKTEQEAVVRRAAVHVISQLLQGLSDRTTQVLSEVLLDLYRALKWVVRSDPDEVAVLHAQIALEELDAVMRRFIFPEQKLQKKIVVLP